MNKKEGEEIIITLLLAFLLAMLLFGCASKRVAASSVTNFDVNRELLNYSIRVDSTFHDRVLTINDHGDTLKDWSWFLSYKFLRDTVILRKDSIVYRENTLPPVEINHIYWWQKSLMYLGVIFLLFLSFKIGRRFV